MSEFWAAIAGAVVGSLVGGVISYLLQLSALTAAKAERAETSAQERRALAYTLVFKIIAIVNNLGDLKMHVDECKDHAAADNHDGPPATFLLPLVNIPDPISIDAATMGMLLSLGDDDTFNSVAKIPQIHNSILPAWSAFSAMRAAFSQLTPHRIDFSTGKGEFAMKAGSPEAVKFYETNRLATDLISRADRDFAEADLVLKNLLQLLKKRLGLKLSAEAKLPAKA
ncbi:hypothetical protein [Mesorhizobium sp. f-mel]